MRGILAAAGLSAALLCGPPAVADDLLSVADLAPLTANVLGVTAGASTDAIPLAVTSTSTAQASISHSTAHLGGQITTGDVALSSFGAGGGVASLQAATGIGNIQQNGIAVALVLSLRP
jgi:hypothetical protein